MELVRQSVISPKIDKIFSEVEAIILAALPDSRVEHIGSTAIPNSITKGDLDIFVGVNAAEFDGAIKVIEKLGFTEKSDTLRTDALCMMVTEKFGEDVAVQIVANGSEFENFIYFRDKLILSPELVCEYNNIKQSAKAKSQECYRELKSSFIKSVLTAPNVIYE